MHNALTNLLPTARQDELARAYKLRFGVLSLILLMLLVGVAAVLLVPTYLFLVGSAQDKQTRLAHIASTLESSNEVALSNRLNALTHDAAALTALAKRPSASALLRTILGVPRPGVTLSGMTFTPTAGKLPMSVVLTGVARTRDALRGYQIALQATPRVLSAALPVSVYAKDTNIEFTITLSLAP